MHSHKTLKKATKSKLRRVFKVTFIFLVSNSPSIQAVSSNTFCDNACHARTLSYKNLRVHWATDNLHRSLTFES